jgi:hypothetical protein
MVNELCDGVSLCVMTELSSRRLSKNVQSLSILDILGWNEEKYATKAVLYALISSPKHTRLSEMNIIVFAVINLVLLICAPVFLMETQQSVFAISPYESGFNHGVIDGKDSCSHPDGCHWYILGPGKGFAFHSWDFVRGYVTGFCTASPGTSSDADQASWDCDKGPDSASWVDEK